MEIRTLRTCRIAAEQTRLFTSPLRVLPHQMFFSQRQELTFANLVYA